MAKAAPCKVAKLSAARLSPSAELKVIRKIAATVKKEPDTARGLAVSAGIITSDGRLRKAFGGKA